MATSNHLLANICVGLAVALFCGCCSETAAASAVVGKPSSRLRPSHTWQTTQNHTQSPPITPNHHQSPARMNANHPRHSAAKAAAFQMWGMRFHLERGCGTPSHGRTSRDRRTPDNPQPLRSHALPQAWSMGLNWTLAELAALGGAPRGAT